MLKEDLESAKELESVSKHLINIKIRCQEK
jgi:hypothetical protein